jgi:glycosyltransferase involved in cell wall biosynthesis
MQFMIFAILSTIPMNKLLTKEKIEIIHTHQRDTALAAVFTNKLTGNKVQVLYTPQRVTSNLPKWLRRIVHFPEILALNWVDHVIALTPAFKEHLVEEYGLNPTKITSIPGGGAAVDEIEQFLSLKTEKSPLATIILCTGMICERKNQLTAVKAIAEVVKTNSHVKLVFTGKVGEVDYYKRIHDYINENKLTNFVEFKGEVSKQELYNLYHTASIFLYPSAAEVRPAVIIEALTFRLPIVASNIQANTDILLDKGCAVLVDPHDIDGIVVAVTRLLKDATLRHSMSEKAAVLSQSMSYKNVARQTMDLYEELVKRKRMILELK